MHFNKLIEAHELFYGGYEHRAPYYDEYLQSKNWEEWSFPDISISEVNKLFSFIKSWDRFFQGDPKKFQEIFREIFSTIRQLENESIEFISLDNEGIKVKIRDMFDKVARCPIISRYESTDASKILHTILPNLIVMWDDKIKNWTVHGVSVGATYALHFLPKMQKEIKEAIETCMNEKNLSSQEAIKYIRQRCDNKTLAKLTDEYNYMKYTKFHQSLWGPGEIEKRIFR